MTIMMMNMKVGVMIMRTTEDQVTDLGLDYPLDKVFIKDKDNVKV